MKNASKITKWLVSLISFGGVAAAVILLTASSSSRKYVAHEWGTFTSVQGGDGVLLDWRPLESSQLPKFVYDWKHPGLKRQGTSPLALGKGSMLALQRMETPVIYFYSDRAQEVDVSVKFPKGLITEWYPQAAQIGPSTVPTSPTISKLDDYAHKAGVKPVFTFASWMYTPSLKDSQVKWANVQILPEKKNVTLPMDQSGSHYFAARDTEANLVQVDSLTATNAAAEYEKFIFYRGVGSFATPLQVTMNEHTITLSNTGSEPLVHLFVLGLENQAGRFIEISELAPGDHRAVEMKSTEPVAPVQKLSQQLGDWMAKSLVSQGLYAREAAAMVKTWRDSWFEEDGVRVLYVLPRKWTDQTLPLALDPTPRELVRVMVGRAEVLTPSLQGRLSEALARANQGDAEAKAQVTAQFKKLGRFAEPAMRLATKSATPKLSQTARNLFEAAAAVSVATAKPL